MISDRDNKEKIDYVYLPKQLMDASRAGTGVKEYRYYFPENDEKSALEFLNALTLENCPDKIIINANSRGKCIDVNSVINFALMLLASEKCKSGMTLSFWGTHIGDDGAIRLVNALQNMTRIKNLTLEVEGNNITSAGAIALAHAMQIYPDKLANVMIHDNNIGIEGIKAFASLLTQGICRPGFELSFRGVDLEERDDEVAEILLEALSSGNCPVGFELNLYDLNLQHSTVLRFAELLKSGKLHDGFSLFLSGTDKETIGDDGVQAFANALMSGCAPTNLTLGIADSNIWKNGGKIFAAAVKHEKCPKGLRLHLPYIHYMHAHEELSEALITSTSLIELNMDGFEDDYKTGYFIRHCCLRNKLMHEHPEYAYAIKKRCIEKDLFHSEYKISDYYTRMKFWMHIESEFPEVYRLSKLPQELVRGLMQLSNLEYDMAPVKYDVSRNGFFRAKGPTTKVYNFDEYAEELSRPKIPDNLKPLIRVDHY